MYDFKVNEKWHQLTFYNTTDSAYAIGCYLSGEEIKSAALRLCPDKSYHIHDFWDDFYVGKFKGTDRLEQVLLPGEARMMSVHEVEPNPQFISTNRHIMQGYVDLAKYPEWDGAKNELSGISKVVGGEIYKVVIALNGFEPVKAEAHTKVKIKVLDEKMDLAELSIESKKNEDIPWSITFKK